MKYAFPIFQYCGRTIYLLGGLCSSSWSWPIRFTLRFLVGVTSCLTITEKWCRQLCTNSEYIKYTINRMHIYFDSWRKHWSVSCTNWATSLVLFPISRFRFSYVLQDVIILSVKFSWPGHPMNRKATKRDLSRCAVLWMSRENKFCVSEQRGNRNT